MKKIILFCFLLISFLSGYSQQDLLAAKNNEELQKKLDSALVSSYFITIDDAGKILEKPSHLKDSTYKYSNGILRYSFDYVANYVDSTSKGRLFFSYEQYRDLEMAKNTYTSIKTENEKNNLITALNDIGDDAFLQKDYLNEPFIIIRKGNKIFKLKVYYVTSQASLDALISTAKLMVSLH
ncbi:MAG: hypothetical protein NTX97_08230 [Bacteroidetes bacterium]|nr:hypothetical protein [Bacteroidota bacterium]